jgi:hypothetical protein
MRVKDCPRDVAAAGRGGGLGPAATTLSSFQRLPVLPEGYAKRKVRWTRVAPRTSCPSAPNITIRPGDRLEVEVVQPDGGRALVGGKLDAVPESAGGRALRIRICDSHNTPSSARGRASGRRVEVPQ